MKYYRILDPGDLMPGEEDESVYLAWKNILDPCIERKIEEKLDFLHYMLINIPVLDQEGELAEKTVLLAKPIDKEEFENNMIQLSISEDLSICYSV